MTVWTDLSGSPNRRHGACAGRDKLPSPCRRRAATRGRARQSTTMCDPRHRPGDGAEITKPTLEAAQEIAKTCRFTTAPSARAIARMQTMFGFVIHPDLIWLAAAFVTVMAGMLAAAPE